MDGINSLPHELIHAGFFTGRQDICSGSNYEYPYQLNVTVDYILEFSRLNIFCRAMHSERLDPASKIYRTVTFLTCPPKTGPAFVREIWHNLRPKSGGGFWSEAVHHAEDYRDTV